MIRIDLKQKKEEGKSKRAPFIKREWFHHLKRVAELFSKIGTDVHTSIFLSVVVALAFLPHLLFSQYRLFLTRQHLGFMESRTEAISALDQELTKLSAFQSELESYEKQKVQVNTRLRIVRELLESRSTVVNVLDTIGQSVPSRAWINNIVFNTATAGDSLPIKITGGAYSNSDISDFADRLLESTYLKDVRLEDVANSREGDVDIRTFSLSLDTRLPSRDVSSPQKRSATGGG